MAVSVNDLLAMGTGEVTTDVFIDGLFVTAAAAPVTQAAADELTAAGVSGGGIGAAGTRRGGRCFADGVESAIVGMMRRSSIATGAFMLSGTNLRGRRDIVEKIYKIYYRLCLISQIELIG